MEVKEVKELLIGLNEISLLLLSVFKDGVQAQDIAVILKKVEENPELCEKLKAAYNGIDQIAAELKDLSLAEGVELGMIELGYIPKLIAALKA